MRHLRRMFSEILIVRLPTGAQIGIPRWMLIPELCDLLSYEEKPRIGLEALMDLCRLVDSQCVAGRRCAESASGGQDAEPGPSHRAATQAALRGRRDLDRASGIDTGTVSRTVAPTAGKRSQRRRLEAQ